MDRLAGSSNGLASASSYSLSFICICCRESASLFNRSSLFGQVRYFLSSSVVFFDSHLKFLVNKLCLHFLSTKLFFSYLDSPKSLLVLLAL